MFGGRVNAIDGNGLVVIKVSIQRLPVLVLLNHKSFCFYHDWYLYGSMFSVCFILLILRSVLGLHWGSEKVFDCRHQRVKLHATSFVHGQMIPKRFVMELFFLPASRISFPVISSRSFDSGLLSECMCVCVKEWLDRPQECHGKQSSVTLSHVSVHLGTVLVLWGLSSGIGSHRKVFSSWETWIRPAYFLRLF